MKAGIPNAVHNRIIFLKFGSMVPVVNEESASALSLYWINTTGIQHTPININNVITHKNQVEVNASQETFPSQKENNMPTNIFYSDTF